MPSVEGFWSSPVTELEIVICSPSRIQAAPSPATIRVWKGDQLSRSSRAGTVERMVFFTAAGAVMYLSFLESLDPCSELRMKRRRARSPAGDHEGRTGHHEGDDSGDVEDGRELDAVVEKRTDAERGDPVAGLIEGDDTACDACRDRGQLLLPEADREGQ